MQLFIFLIFIVAYITAPAPAAAQMRAQLIADGLTKPVSMARNPADSQMLLVAEHVGRIRVLINGELRPEPFLDIRSEVAQGGELGLLSVVLAPDYGTSGRLFLSFVNTAGHSVVSRFTRSAENPLAADPSSRFDLRWAGGDPWIEQPFNTHKGGDLAFGSDGYLYLGLGDGGASDDPLHMAQNPGSLLGKMLRIDVSVSNDDPEGYDVPGSNPFVGIDGVLPEIWSFGLRNPWRFSFDDVHRGGTGAMVIADVGQGAWEEIDYEPALAGGRNYGWRNREGAHDNVTSEAAFTDALTDPVYEYPHVEGRSITGGYVYRGAALQGSLRGRYFFADFVFGRVWSLGLAVGEQGEATPTDLQEHTADLGGAGTGLSSFGVDAAGELYLLSYAGGRIYKLVPPGSAPTGTGGTGPCSTPDPFVAIGGGTCAGGEWLPPGVGTPAVPTTPPATPPASSPCVGSDPFAGMGGGACVNGEWLPPGHPGIPASTEPPTTTPPPVEPPSTPLAPPPTSTGCSTPDPFSTIGGGTCWNGDWLPPGYPVPGGGETPPSAPPTPPSPPAPPPVPPAGGCTTPDPFEILGGGTCVGGEWLPPMYSGG